MKKLQEVLHIGELMGNNPFVNGQVGGDECFKIKVDVILKKGYKEEVEDTHGLSYVVEVEEYAKLFRGSGCIEQMYNLNARGRELLMYILTHIKKNEDFIAINVQNYMGKHKIGSINTYKDGVKNLVLHKYITPIYGYKNAFWINPKYFFNGNRITTYPKHLVERRTMQEYLIKKGNG